ncbi:MAG: hypothetical protein ACYC3X_22895 [Pirellulaceae bacterium]
MNREKTFTLALCFALLGGVSGAADADGGEVVMDPGATTEAHFDPKWNMPSKFTIELQKGLRRSMPFEDKRDFEEAKKGYIATPPFKQIMADAGNVAWDMASYEFLLTDKELDSIHPSLQRQAILNMADTSQIGRWNCRVSRPRTFFFRRRSSRVCDSRASRDRVAPSRAAK